jgi:competence protein ComEC
MKRPLGIVAFCYIGGILLARGIQLPLAYLFATAFVAAVAALAWKGGRGWLLAVAFVLAGWANLTWQTGIIAPDDLRLLAGPELQIAAVRGTLRASPVPRVFEWQGREIWHSSVEIDLDQVRLQNQWRPAFGKIVAFAPGVLASNYFSGQNVEVSGLLGAPTGPRAEGLFDARNYYAQHGIYYQLRTETEADWAVVPQEATLRPPLSDRFTAWARNALALGLEQEDDALRLTWTLALDWKAPLTDMVEDPFMRAGTYHIFAVDGLRIGLLAGIVMGLLRMFRLPRFVCGIFALPLIWFYVAITGWPASAVRAAVMMSVVIIGWAGRRPADLVNSLFGAALLILLWEPCQLFQAGFQLSFLVVLSIALLLPWIRNLLHAWIFKSDPFLPDALKPRWPAPLRVAALFVIDTCAVSLAAWLGSIPLAAAYFHLFTPVSVPANIMVVPITALALVSVIGSLFTAPIFPGLAVLFNHASWLFMKSIIAISGWCAHWRFGAWNVQTPSPVLFVLYYLLLFSMLTGWIFRMRFKKTFIALAAVLAGCWAVQTVVAAQSTHLYLLPLDGGSATFTGDALFDAGGARTAESVVKPFLRAQGVNTLDFLALTVGHAQEGGGAMLVLTNFSARQLIINPAPHLSAAFGKAVEEAKQAAPWRAVQAGDDVRGWAVLHPKPPQYFTTADDNALVFRGEIKGHSILLLSTLGRAGQGSLIANNPGLRAEIVVAGLPSRDEPLCEPLLDLVQARLIIIVDSELPATRRATPKLRQRLERRSIPVIYCHEAGSLKFTFSDTGWTVQNATGETLAASH